MVSKDKNMLPQKEMKKDTNMYMNYNFTNGSNSMSVVCMYNINRKVK